MTAGQQLASTLRRVLRIGTRTRRYRKNEDLFGQMIETIYNANAYPGYYTGDTDTALRSAWVIYCSWTKHVDGHRIDPVLRSKLMQRSPWQIAKLLGEMVDAEVRTVHDGEMFFRRLASS